MSTDLKTVNSDWQKVRFDEIATVVTDRIDKPIESGLKDYIGLEHLDTDCIRIKRFGSTEDVDATKFLCKKGDIIFGKRNSYLRKVAISDREAVVSAHSMVLRPTGDKIYPGFLPCFMQSSIFWKTAHSISEGSMSPTIKWKTLAAQEFWLPSIEEQENISEVLWSIEDNIQKTEKFIETTETLKQGLLNELLTKGIGHTLFKDSELGMIPEEWEIKMLGDMANINGRIGWRGLTTEDYVAKGAILLGVRNITKDCKLDLTDLTYIPMQKYEESPEIMVKSGDILLAKTGATTGKSCVVDRVDEPTTVNAAVNIIRCKSEINNYYLNYYISSTICQNQIWSYASESARPNLFQRDIKKIKVTVPNLDEQRTIANKLKSIEAELNNLYKHLLNLNDIKKKITNELVSGKEKVLN